ncbi:VF530 family protein [Olivibacter sp. CPCC 100613]|uniref:VF530 family protein n=1 Tax=Olivibacter sp. CPCC 100613 TaxID=3079931 RepID=UPI002FF8190F
MSRDFHKEQPNNPMHGVTLEMVITRLERHYGWKELARLIRLNCFANNPSIKSSLQFLRRTPWAREKVETLYMETKFEDSNYPSEG